MQSDGNDFSIPESFIGRNVLIKMAIPLMSQNAGFSLPGFEATLKADLPGALLLLHNNVEVIYPKSRVWQIERVSELSIAKTLPGGLLP